MNDLAPADTADRLRRALAAIDRLQARLEATREPIAVIGVGCRFPGADGPDAFWRLLVEGREAITDVPADRWDAAAWRAEEPATPGRMATGRFGVVDHLREFDAAFFGIAPREARGMDPQQRLLLEVAWEALEHAGVAPSGLKGSRTGVYVAACGTDFFQLLAARPPEAIDAYFASGTVHSMASGRLSYLLGLNGPSLTVDTACSSSLVAVHLAVKAIRAGECDLALAGGVNRILLPTYGVAFSQARMLAPDGRCKTFSAAADGYARAEGAGVVALKRLSAAERDGDRILAVIRGSAINQDGASSGLTVPNGPAQQAAIRAALADARLTPADIACLEAHGTGTALGDPIETGALAAVFAEGRTPEAPLLIGSVKANIGHAEGAAGVAGLIKLILTLQAGIAPPHRGGEPANPLIDWAGGRLAAPPRATPLVARGGRLIGGVSAFGFSGTNAHVVVEAPPPRPPAPALASEPRLFALSAAGEEALEAMAGRYGDFLRDAAPGDWADICRTAGAGRSALPARLALVASSPQEAAARLAEAARGRAPARQGKTGFVFTGQGAFAAGPGLDPADRPGAFGATLGAAAAILDPLLGARLDALLADPARLAARTDLAQPAQFALQAALLAAFREAGVEPDLTLGHSLGEFAAAHAAGVMDLETGLRLTAARGKAMQAAVQAAIEAGAGATGMLAVALDAAALAPRLPADLVLAADNGPRACVIAGPVGALGRFAATLEAGVAAERLPTPAAFHSPAMAAAAEAFGAALAGARLQPARPGFVSALTGAPMQAEAADPQVWLRQMLQPVRFRDGLDRLAEAGVDVVVELGPRPLLAGPVRASFTARGAALRYEAAARPGVDARAGLLAALGGLFVAGRGVDFAALEPEGRRIALPVYPWRRVRHWPDDVAQPITPQGAARDDAQAMRAGRVDDFYSRLTRLFAGLERHAEAHPEDDIFLTYAPFAAPVPGFSWIRVSLAPQEHPAQFRLMLEAQRAMRRLLFRHVDFAAARRALDFGCGHGSDLVALARRHPHLTLVGQTISAAQAEIGRARAARLGLADRIDIRHADSARAAAGGPFDLAFGFEVVHHVADKAGLFAALGAALGPEGRFVAADFIATEAAGVEDAKTMSGFMTAEQWAERLADAGLAATDIVDVSAAVANFLIDDDLEASIAAIGGDGAVAPDIADAFRGFVRLGRLLAEGLARYILVDAVKRPDLDRAGLAALNRAGLAALNRARLAAPIDFGAVSLARETYVRRWIETPARDAAAALATAATEAAADPALAEGRAALPRLEAIALGYAARALAGDAGAGDPERRAPLAAALARSRHAAAADPEAAAARLAAEAPGLAAELDLTQRCGRALGAVLAGTRDPVELLFPEGDMSALRRLYGETAVARAANRALAQVAADLAPAGPLRCLEIGAGAGGSTRALLDALDRPGLTYDFTDVSPAFLSEARTRFGARPGFRARRLDIETAPEAQGFAEGGYDLVVAANVLHATADLTASLRRAAALLAPGGALILLEGTEPRAWVDLTFGLTEGWRRFADLALRPEHPLVDIAVWRGLGAGLGLETAAAGLGDGLPFDQALIVFRRPPQPVATAICGRADGLARRLAAALRARGERVMTIAAVEAPIDWPRDATRRRVVHIAEHVAEPEAGDDPAGAARAAAMAASGLLAALARRGETCAVVLASLGAVGARDAEGDDLPGLAAATLRGIGATARLEHPEWRLRRVDLDPSGDPLAELLDELRRDDGEDDIVWRDGRRRAARLVRRVWPQPRRGVAPARADRTVLVSGGLRGLGLASAARLAEAGARHVVLVGRGAPDAETRAGLERIAAAGATARLERADIGDRAALAAILDRARDLPPIGTVIHAAGALADRSIAALTEADWAAVFAPKVAGALALHAATRDQPIEHFVMFSSAAATLGAAGQANHAAANAWLEEFARWRRARGLPALAIGWGAWARIGAAARRIGGRATGGWTRMIDPREGLDALLELMAGEAPAALALPIDWARFAIERADLAAAPFFADCARAGRAAAREPVEAGAPRGAGTIAEAVAAVLELPAATLDPHRPLAEYGLDSLMAITLRNRLRRDAGREVSLSTILDGATLASLAGAEASAAPAAAPEPAPRAGAADPDTPADDLLDDLLAAQEPAGAGRP